MFQYVLRTLKDSGVWRGKNNEKVREVGVTDWTKKRLCDPRNEIDEGLRPTEVPIDVPSEKWGNWGENKGLECETFTQTLLGEIATLDGVKTVESLTRKDWDEWKNKKGVVGLGR